MDPPLTVMAPQEAPAPCAALSVKAPAPTLVRPTSEASLKAMSLPEKVELAPLNPTVRKAVPAVPLKTSPAPESEPQAVEALLRSCDMPVAAV